VLAIEEAKASDEAAIMRLARGEGLFSREEADTVQELLNDYLNAPDQGGYYFVVAHESHELLGFACYGPTPLTRGTFDLYWICVDPAARGKGIGRALMLQVEDRVQASGGRLLLIETSGRPDYAPTRAFYEGIGAERTAVVPEFYGPGDDLIIYSRRF
jgi:ribosomal protein S18 acetylase RimI-like enzyme